MESVLEIMRRDDLLALALFMVCWLGYEAFVAVSVRRGKGLPAAMQA
ncbi:MAG: hypothetical protein JJ937_17235, partial [Parvibaculum sp.]|nr:hypothetical protein [Parvibaculum sp.]